MRAAAGLGHDGPMAERVRWDLVSGTLGWLLLVAIIGIFDLLTGPEYGFGFFYLLAVVPAAWQLGRGPGLVVAVASGVAWFFADAVQQRLGTTLWPALWNASSRLLVFVLAAILVDIVVRERQRLRRLDRDRSQFMRVLEHELAGPGKELADRLRALRAAGGATPAQLQPLAERAQDLEFLSRDFVSLGKLQSGELWLKHGSVDLRAIVEELRTRATEGGPRLPITLSSGSFAVEGDDARLRQAIGGLLNEARDTAGTSDVTIDLRRDAGNARLTISAGVGPFLPVAATDPRGVGVELARMVIEGHGGRLDYRREAASKAARFVVQLPLA
jgi:signal transduction histidine kinase